MMSNLVTKAVENIYKMDMNELNQVVEAINLKRTHLAKQITRSILVGDVVGFTGKRGEQVSGIVSNGVLVHRWSQNQPLVLRMGPFSEMKQLSRAAAIKRLLDSNPQLDSPTRIMWETKLKNLALTEARYNERVVEVFKGIRPKYVDLS